MLRVDTVRGTLTTDNAVIPCVIGRGGPCAEIDKREGDGCTPLGRFRLRAALLRPDRVQSPASSRVIAPLPWRWLRRADGWSDDPRDPAYNRPVRHPHGFSAERLWRDDGLYDVVVVIGHNDSPPRAGMGSAIFLHCTAPDRAATEGCVAIDRASLVALLPALGPSDWLDIG